MTNEEKFILKKELILLIAAKLLKEGSEIRTNYPTCYLISEHCNPVKIVENMFKDL